DILRELEQQEEREPTQPTEEERPLQGSYYAPFALPVRPEPKHGQASAEASQATAATAFGEVGKEQSLHGKTTIGPLGSIDNIHAAPQKREEVLGDGPVAQNAVESDADRAAFVTFDDEAQLAPSAAFEPEEAPVIFERERLDDRRPAATAFAEPQPARTAEVPQPSFAFDKAEDEADTATDEIGEALDVASRVRTAFALSDEEEVTETASAAYQAAPREERYAADAMRQAPRVVAHAEPVQDEKPAPTPPPAPREYRLPPISLLNEDKAIKDDDHSEENQQKIDILRRTLESFNVHIKEEVICSRGPTITRYEVRPEIGVPVRSIMNRIDDISLYMEAQVRIAPIQGKAAVGVEVPNKVRETVYLRTLLESEPFKRSKNPVEVALGVGIGGHIQMCDLTAMPHLLVAGATKSGKSVCINTIILSLLYKTSPKDLRLILIDPKRVEFKPYMHLPHLYAPIITETTHAVGALACAVREMERRYTLLEDVGARNFEAYNEKVKNDPEREHLPYLVIIIDEYYDLKMACPNNDLENFACRLAQKARAAGIHLIIGTQRPSVNVITGTLKANIPSRIAFTVMQQVDSRTILDAVGAELLTGRGDMLYAPMGEKPIRLQGSFVSDDEVESVVTFVRERNDPVQYNQAFMEQIEIEVARAANAGKKSEDFDEFAEDEDTDVDPKFYDAVVLAVQTQKVATSLLQRRLGVGYGRAAKIIDRMEELGLVTPAEGNKPRKLLPAAQGYLDHVADLDGEEDGGDFDTDGNY
ncbi:MAG: DNA translocase FtsK, partial [Clostridia bacterium]|nr:DNA translocase FtsK [Clostridia bacterium]